MVRIGGFLKTQNRVRRQRARGRFISPYQVGGTLFGKSMTSRYPLVNTSSRLQDIWPRGVKPWKGMKGGTIFGKSTRLRSPGMTSPLSSGVKPWMACRRQKPIKKKAPLNRLA